MHLCIPLYFMTSIFTVNIYFSLGESIIGLYIIMASFAAMSS